MVQHKDCIGNGTRIKRKFDTVAIQTQRFFVFPGSALEQFFLPTAIIRY